MDDKVPACMTVGFQGVLSDLSAVARGIENSFQEQERKLETVIVENWSKN